MNEPGDPKHTDLIAFYERVEVEIRKVDPNHMLFLDANTYARDFSAFTSVLPNSVYAIHDYALLGFPMYEEYTGASAQNAALEKQYKGKIEFMVKHNVPIWNGEFGPVYASPNEENYEAINQCRFNLLGQQLKNYKGEQMSWSIWTYKDIGFQGMVYTDPESPYIRLLKPFLEKKKRMGLDKWGRDDQYCAQFYEPMMKHLEEEIPSEYHRIIYPHHWGMRTFVHRAMRECVVSEIMVHYYADYFKDKSFEELDELAASFKFENCLKRGPLNAILKADAEL